MFAVVDASAAGDLGVALVPVDVENLAGVERIFVGQIENLPDVIGTRHARCPRIATVRIHHGRMVIDDAMQRRAQGTAAGGIDTLVIAGNAGTHGEIDATIAASEHIGIAVDIGNQIRCDVEGAIFTGGEIVVRIERVAALVAVGLHKGVHAAANATDAESARLHGHRFREDHGQIAGRRHIDVEMDRIGAQNGRCHIRRHRERIRGIAGDWIGDTVEIDDIGAGDADRADIAIVEVGERIQRPRRVAIAADQRAGIRVAIAGQRDPRNRRADRLREIDHHDGIDADAGHAGGGYGRSNRRRGVNHRGEGPRVVLRHVIKRAVEIVDIGCDDRCRAGFAKREIDIRIDRSCVASAADRDRIDGVRRARQGERAGIGVDVLGEGHHEVAVDRDRCRLIERTGQGDGWRIVDRRRETLTVVADAARMCSGRLPCEICIAGTTAAQLQRGIRRGRVGLGHHDVRTQNARRRAIGRGEGAFVTEELDDRRALHQGDAIGRTVLNAIDRVDDVGELRRTAATAALYGSRGQHIGVVRTAAAAVVQHQRIGGQVFTGRRHHFNRLIEIAGGGRVVVMDFIDEYGGKRR